MHVEISDPLLERETNMTAAIPVPELKAIQKSTAIPLYSGQFFGTCAVGGALACGVTHWFVTPLDLVKCRRQVNPNIYKGVFNGWSTIFKAEGLRGLYLGQGPTAIGYSFQGACKFGFYEYFKKKYADLAGPEFAQEHRTLLYLGASASAELIADLALCPWEALKVRMQTSTTPFASGTMSGLAKIGSTEGITGFYKGLGPLWMRQIPYTMVKFATFEKTVEAIYKHLLSKPKHEYNKMEQLGVTFAAGYWAGIFCAIVSHPADTVVSKLNNITKVPGETGSPIVKILKDLGFTGIWRGLTPRIAMIGTLTALQWFIYDTFKVYVGLPTSGGANPEPEKK